MNEELLSATNLFSSNFIY